MCTSKVCFALFFVFTNAIATNLDYRECPKLTRLEPCQYSRYRTLDGTCNNLKYKNYGKANWPYARLTAPTYSDGIYGLPKQSDGSPYASARVVSNTLFPAGNVFSKNFTLALMQLGQLIAHDMGLAAGSQPGYGGNPVPSGCCSDNKFGKDSSTKKCAADILIPRNDTDYSQVSFDCLGFARTTTTGKYNCKLKKYKDQINQVTSFLDLSIVYGNNVNQSHKIRSFTGGKLKTAKRNGQMYPPILDDVTSLCPRAKDPSYLCFVTGDKRSNQHSLITYLQVIFVREHNRISEILGKHLPNIDDEVIFQEARRILIAQWQHFVYDEILPLYLGPQVMKQYGLSTANFYNETVDSSTLQEFATAAWRHFHNLIVGFLKTYNVQNRRYLQKVNFSDTIDRGVEDVVNDDVNIDTVMLGLTIQAMSKSGNIYDHDIKSRFAKNDDTGFGLDLVSIDIQRARDHGLGKYVDMLEFLNLPVPTTWKDMERFIPRKSVAKLKKLYANVASVELFAGASLETVLPGTLVGPTFSRIAGMQFRMTKTGDKYFYDNGEKHSMNSDQIAAIKKVPIARLFCDNTAIEQIQMNVLKIVGPTNPVLNCSEIPSLDLTPWINELSC